MDDHYLPTKPSLTPHTVYHQEEIFSHHWLSFAMTSTCSLSAASSDVCRCIIINYLSFDTPQTQSNII